MENTNPHRLSRHVSPTRYKLTLRPDISEASFAGSVRISVTVHESVSQIEMNAIELDIGSVILRRDGEQLVPTVRLIADTERLVLDFDEPVSVGEAEIDIAFSGVLNDRLRGFYRSTFSGDDGNEHTIATTQFESTNARRCFPCWDEPDRKAVFEVALAVPTGMLAVSAMAEISRSDLGDGYTLVTFGATPAMSTYLLAFVVGELEASPPVDVDGVQVRVVHRPGRGNLVDFASDAAAFCLRWFTEYFGVPYFGDKIDLLAIPDFAFGAMENTGCVTFREVLLLVDPDTTTQPEQQRSVSVIAHELAHMWFGNLVTMQWWEGLWLKEAFATFMETAATDAYRPDWKVWDGFALDRSAAYEVDALHSTRPIEYEVISPADAEGMYDVLTYEKGASVVRMLEQFVGPDRFREGIRQYMRTHAFDNTVTSDLWYAIEAATDVPVDEIMHEWIYQRGFPLIDASVDDGEVTLRQRAFRLIESEPIEADDPQEAGADEVEWKIPVTVDVGGEATSVLMVPHGRIPMDSPDALVIIDPDSHGFFRVRYDATLADRLGKQLMNLTAGQRYTLFDDLFDLVLAGLASVADFVQLANALRNERTPPVWSAVASGFSTLAHVAPDREQRAMVGRLWSDVASAQLHTLGFEQGEAEAQADPLLNEVRASLFSALGSLSHDPAVIGHARAIFDGTTKTDNASIESAAVRVVASTGSRADYDEVFRRFRAAASPQVERRYLFALARFDDHGAIADLCERTLDGSIRSQDAGAVLEVALSNRWHGESVWEFVSSNWDRLREAVPENSFSRLLGGVQWLEHGETHERVHEFLAEHPIPQAKLAVVQHLERLDVHVALRRRFLDELDEVISAV